MFRHIQTTLQMHSSEKSCYKTTWIYEFDMLYQISHAFDPVSLIQGCPSPLPLFHFAYCPQTSEAHKGTSPWSPPRRLSLVSHPPSQFKPELVSPSESLPASPVHQCYSCICLIYFSGKVLEGRTLPYPVNL